MCCVSRRGFFSYLAASVGLLLTAPPAVRGQAVAADEAPVQVKQGEQVERPQPPPARADRLNEGGREETAPRARPLVPRAPGRPFRAPPSRMHETPENWLGEGRRRLTESLKSHRENLNRARERMKQVREPSVRR